MKCVENGYQFKRKIAKDRSRCKPLSFFHSLNHSIALSVSFFFIRFMCERLLKSKFYRIECNLKWKTSVREWTCFETNDFLSKNETKEAKNWACKRDRVRAKRDRMFERHATESFRLAKSRLSDGQISSYQTKRTQKRREHCEWNVQ